MKTCEDCTHYDICATAYGDCILHICDSFKDASKFIELPCAIGDYCIYQNNLWYVNNITYCCDSSFLLWISMADRSPYGAEASLSEVKFISEEDAKNWRQ